MNYVLISGSKKKLEINPKIIEFLKSKNLNNQKITFIASTFNDYNANDYYTNKMVKLFNKQNLQFQGFYIIDNRLSNKEMIKVLKESAIIFLLGGDTLEQIKGINKNNLKKYIKNQVVMGMSAGAINMAKRIVLAKDEDDNIPKLSIYEGLGISNINIEPHCDFNDKKHWQDLEEASMYTTLIVMHDNCFIISDNGKLTYYGDYIVLKNKIIYNSIFEVGD